MLLSIADNCITHHLVGKHETSQDNLAPGRKAAPSAGKKKHTPVFGSAWCSPRCSHALHGIHRMQNACRVPALIWGTDVEKKDVEKNTHTHKLKTKGGPRSTFMKLKQNSLSVFCNPSFPIISASPHSVPQWKKHVGDRPGCRASQVPVLNAAGLIAKTGG